MLESEYEAQKNIAPFLKYPVLRRIIQTFTNDQQGDFSKWACNPHVIEMLGEAKRLIDEGYVLGGWEPALQPPANHYRPAWRDTSTDWPPDLASDTGAVTCVRTGTSRSKKWRRACSASCRTPAMRRMLTSSARRGRWCACPPTSLWAH